MILHPIKQRSGIMKVIDEVQKQKLFAPLAIRDHIEPARAKIRGFANNPQKITKEHLLARRGLLDSLQEALPQRDEDPRSALQSITRIESVLSELDQEMSQNKSVRIDPDLRDSEDAQDLPMRINEARARIEQGVKTVKQLPDIINFIADEDRAKVQKDVTERIKDGKLQNLKRYIGASFDESNLNQQRAIDHIYDFNEAQSNAITQVSKEEEIRAVFSLLVNHSKLLDNRSPSDVIKSAQAGCKIVHDALTVKGTMLSMGDWAAAEPKIMNKLLPELCKLDVATLNTYAKEITAEYAQSIWNKRDTSAAALIGRGARSITGDNLALVTSNTLEAQLGQSGEVEASQTGVLSGLYESARSAIPNPLKILRSAMPTFKTASSSLSPESMIPTTPPPEPKPYQEECVLAARLFESAMTNTKELQTLAGSSCLGISAKVEAAASSEDLKELQSQILQMKQLAATAENFVQEASSGVQEISFKLSEDLVDVGVGIEGRLAQESQESSIPVLSESDLFSDTPLPTTPISGIKQASSSPEGSENELHEGIKRAKELRDISQTIDGLDLPHNAAAALRSINATLKKADQALEKKMLELAAKEAAEKIGAEVQNAASQVTSTQPASRWSVPSFLKSKPSPAESAKLRKPGTYANAHEAGAAGKLDDYVKQRAEEGVLKRAESKEQAMRDAERLALEASSWRYNPIVKASASASAGADAVGAATLEGLRDLSGGVTFVALTTAAEGARLAARYPKAAAAAGAVYGAARVVAAVVAAAPYVAGAAVAGAVLQTETGRAIAGHAIEGSAMVGGAIAEAAINNPRAAAVVTGAAGVIGAGLALMAAAPYIVGGAAVAAAANTEAGRKAAAAVLKGVGDGMKETARNQLDGGIGSVEMTESAVDGANRLASAAQALGSGARNFVRGGDTPPTSQPPSPSAASLPVRRSNSEATRR